MNQFNRFSAVCGNEGGSESIGLTPAGAVRGKHALVLSTSVNIYFI